MAEFLQTLNQLACQPLRLQSLQEAAPEFTVRDAMLEQMINDHQQRMAQSNQRGRFLPRRAASRRNCADR